MDSQMIEVGIMELKVDVDSDKDLKLLVGRIKRAFYNEKDIKFYISVASTMGEFQTKLGEMIYNNTELGIEIPVEFTEYTDSMMYLLIGRMVLDTYITNTYWIKSDAEKKVYEIRGMN